MSKNILVVDIEATCWEPRRPDERNEIIEIGIVEIINKEIARKESIIVLPPTTEISEFCTTLTTLTPEFVDEHGIEYHEAMDILLRKYRSDKQVFASWGDYDRSAFENNCNWNRAPHPFARNMHLNVKTLFAAKYGYTGGQERCGRDIGVKMEGTAHRGIDDAYNIAKILLKLL